MGHLIQAEELDTEHQISQILFTPNYKDINERIKIKDEEIKPNRFNRDLFEHMNKAKQN